LDCYEISWTARAIKDLRTVFEFYSEQAGHQKAIEIVRSMVEKVDILADTRFVELGAFDEQFAHLQRKYKKLIYKNIKITYRVSDNKHIVYINRVFDTRQNPLRNL
jgi:plasmid stabilization system protein ParE